MAQEGAQPISGDKPIDPLVLGQDEPAASEVRRDAQAQAEGAPVGADKLDRLGPKSDVPEGP